MWGRAEKKKPHTFKGSKQTSKISDYTSLVCTGNKIPRLYPKDLCRNLCMRVVITS